MASFNKVNLFVQDLANKLHNLGSDALKLQLSDVAPTATSTTITEITAGNGYVAGGNAVGSVTSLQTSGLYKLIPPATVVWTASGGGISQFRYVVLMNTTAASGHQIIGWWDVGAETNVASGNTFTANLDTTNGLLQIQ